MNNLIQALSTQKTSGTTTESSNQPTGTLEDGELNFSEFSEQMATEQSLREPVTALGNSTAKTDAQLTDDNIKSLVGIMTGVELTDNLEPEAQSLQVGEQPNIAPINQSPILGDTPSNNAEENLEKGIYAAQPINGAPDTPVTLQATLGKNQQHNLANAVLDGNLQTNDTIPSQLNKHAAKHELAIQHRNYQNSNFEFSGNQASLPVNQKPSPEKSLNPSGDTLEAHPVIAIAHSNNIGNVVSTSDKITNVTVTNISGTTVTPELMKTAAQKSINPVRGGETPAATNNQQAGIMSQTTNNPSSALTSALQTQMTANLKAVKAQDIKVLPHDPGFVFSSMVEAGTTSQASTSTTVELNMEDFSSSRQFVEKLAMEAKKHIQQLQNITNVRFQLNPHNLGLIDISVSDNAGTLSVDITATNERTLSIINDNIDLLRQNLEFNQGERRGKETFEEAYEATERTIEDSDEEPQSTESHQNLNTSDLSVYA